VVDGVAVPNQVSCGNGRIEQKDGQGSAEQRMQGGGCLQQEKNHGYGGGDDYQYRAYPGEVEIFAEQRAGECLAQAAQSAYSPDRMGKPAGIAENKVENDGGKQLQGIAHKFFWSNFQQPIQRGHIDALPDGFRQSFKSPFEIIRSKDSADR